MCDTRTTDEVVGEIAPPDCDHRCFRARTRGLRPTFAVAGVQLFVIVVLTMATYLLGHQTPPESRFLDTWRPPIIDEAYVAHAVEYALRSDEPNDVVFVGDSTCRCDVDPAEFERLTRLRAYNLGSLRGLGPTGFVVTAKAYLLSHPKPKLVVLCVTPICFEANPDTVGGPLPKRFAASYGPAVAEVSMLDRVAHFCRVGAGWCWTPTDRLATRMRGKDVRSVPLNGLESETYWTLQQTTLKSRGFFGLPGAHGPPKGIGRLDGPLVRDDWNRGMHRLAQVCSDADVRLLIQFCPISRELAQARDFSPLETWANEMTSTHPNVSVVQPVIRIYSRDSMWDLIHLNSSGVKEFMRMLAESVQAAQTH
jgi:hypothetical protein